MNFKEIHIGKLISQKAAEENVDINRICNFLKCSTHKVNEMYAAKSIDSEILLRWSKLLSYDFFRIYSQHLLLFSSSKKDSKKSISGKNALPEFRKNIYTKEIIDFILDAVRSGEKTKQQIMDEYKIPKTTLYKWISKYNEEK